MDDEKLLAAIKLYVPNFQSLIRKRLGIIVENRLPELEKTLVTACQKFNLTPENYLEKLQTCPNDSTYLEYLVIGITIGETYFFRDENQMALLKNHILPTIIQKKIKENNHSIRIWSAGCSSGEEIYTIAMLLTELLPHPASWNIQLLGTDINTKLLKKAISGRYSEWSMRSIPSDMKNKYFLREGQEYVLSNSLKNNASFEYLNLNEDSYPSMINGTNAQDLILCRNVLIYFDTAIIKHLMKKLFNSIIPGGYLLLGASDPIEISETGFEFNHQNGIIFTRPTADKEFTASLKPIKKAYEPLLSPTLTEKILQPHTKLTHYKPTVDNKKITELLNLAQWQETLQLINQYELFGIKNSFLLNAKATALANLGKLHQAIESCLSSITLDPTNTYSYFIYALALTETNHLQEAETALRKTLFLDHKFVEAHFQLGLLLLRQQHHDAGIKCLKNALTIISTKNEGEAVSGSPGISYTQLAETLKHEIELYTNLGKHAHGD